MRTALEGLVEALESEPERAVRAIEVMPEAERRQVVEEWNATEADYPQEKCVHELFEAQVEKSPDAVALVYEDEQLSLRRVECSSQSTGASPVGVGCKTWRAGGDSLQTLG